MLKAVCLAAAAIVLTFLFGVLVGLLYPKGPPPVTLARVAMYIPAVLAVAGAFVAGVFVGGAR
jgi:hypothetical protein